MLSTFTINGTGDDALAKLKDRWAADDAKFNAHLLAMFKPTSASTAPTGLAIPIRPVSALGGAGSPPKAKYRSF